MGKRNVLSFFSWFWCFELGTSDRGSEQRQMECVASLVRQWVFLIVVYECSRLHFLYMIFLQWRVWSWLRMNASYRLNTCKSRGNGIECLHSLDVDRRTGEYRVSNLPFTWGYPVERRPNTRYCSLMASDMNKRFIGKGWGCVWLACWWGKGSPRQRSVGVLRGRSPTLELRHGPNSYGRQQWGILVNGRKPEPAK